METLGWWEAEDSHACDDAVYGTHRAVLLTLEKNKVLHSHLALIFPVLLALLLNTLPAQTRFTVRCTR